MIKGQILVDSGPLVAFLNRHDRYYEWARSKLAEVRPPLITCEAVIVETFDSLRALPEGGPALIELIRRGLVTVPFRLEKETRPVARLLKRYAHVPMSLANACLVRLSEQQAEGVILTLDPVFRTYRKQGRQMIPLYLPSDR